MATATTHQGAQLPFNQSHRRPTAVTLKNGNYSNDSNGYENASTVPIGRVGPPMKAMRHPSRNERPQLVLIGGYAGSGKSLLGHALAQETGWAMLDKDTVTRPVVELALESLGRPPHDRESMTYLSAVRPREYDALLSAATENLEIGTSAIAAAPFIKEFQEQTWVERTRAKYESLGAALHLIWVRCDAETMLARIRRRAAARDAGKLENWSSYLTGLDINFKPRGPHTIIENSATSLPLRTQARELLARIREPRWP